MKGSLFITSVRGGERMKKTQINWQVRLKSKKFWLAIVPAVLFLANVVASWFGYDIQMDVLSAEAMRFVEAVFTVMVIMGIVTDPTTSGLNDSERAMGYKR